MTSAYHFAFGSKFYQQKLCIVVILHSKFLHLVTLSGKVLVMQPSSRWCYVTCLYSLLDADRSASDTKIDVLDTNIGVLVTNINVLATKTSVLDTKINVLTTNIT